MNRLKYAGLPYTGTTADTCTVTTFLKDLFARCRDGKTDPEMVIKHKAADVKTNLEHLNAGATADMTYGHLAALERSMPDAAFRYATVYKDNKPVLFTYFQLFTLTAKNFNLHLDKSFMKNIMSLFLNLKKAKVLVLGNALRTETQSYCYDTAVFTKQEALDAVIALAEKTANTDNANTIILPGMDGVSAHTAQTLAKMEYTMPLEDIVMEMPVNPAWKILGDYTDALTRKYKTRTNKILASGSLLTTRPLTEADINKYQKDITRLFTGVINKQPFIFTSSGAEYIAALKQLYKDKFEVMTYFKDDTLVAFYSAFAGDDDYEVFYVGFDTTLNSEYQLYFNIMLGTLERAITLRKPLLKLGRTSLDAKASLGAKPRNNDYYIKLKHVPDVAIKWFVSYFSSLEHTKWKLRNPLKE